MANPHRAHARIEDASGDLIDLTLAQYSEKVDSALAPQYYSAQPDYSNLPPEKELSIQQENYIGGMGLEYEDGNFNRFHVSRSMDTRIKDKVQLGLLGTVVSYLTVTALSVTNGDFETGDTTGWVQDAGTIAADNAQNHTDGGTYSLKMAINSQGSQDIASGTDYKGRRIRVSCWVYQDAANNSTFTVDDGVDTTNSSTSATTGSWVQILATHTANAAATGLTIQLKNGAGGAGAAYFDDVAITPPTAGAVKLIDFNGGTYGYDGNIIMKKTGFAGSWTYVYNDIAVTQYTDMKVMTLGGADYLFFARGNDYTMQYLNTSDTLSTSVATGTAKYIEVLGLSMYINDTNSTIVSSANPLSGGTAFVTSKQVGFDATDISDLIDYNGTLYIMKEDYPYYLDSDGNIQPLTTQTGVYQGSSYVLEPNGENAYVWGGYLFMIYNSRTGGLLSYDGTTLAWVQPSLYGANLNNEGNPIYSMVGDDEWLYVAVKGQSATAQTDEILAVRRETVDGVTDWRWHNIATGSGGVTAPPTSNQLFIDSGTSTTKLYDNRGVSTADSVYFQLSGSYETGASVAAGFLETSWQHYNLKGDNKAWIKIQVRLGYTYDADVYFECHYKKLGDSSWTDAGDLKGTATNRTAELYLPQDASSNEPISTYMKFKFVAKSDTSAKTPIMLGWDVRAIWYPPERRLISMQVLVEDNITMSDGRVSPVKASALKTTLDAINSSSWPREFRPPYWSDSDDTVYVKKLPVEGAEMELIEIPEGNSANLRYAYNLLLEEVKLS